MVSGKIIQAPVSDSSKMKSSPVYVGPHQDGAAAFVALGCERLVPSRRMTWHIKRPS
jgi:hypothetical protein